MASSEELIRLYNQYGASNYAPLPVVISKASGSRVWDVEGKEYLDFLACYSALNFGHQHPKLVRALKEQADAVCLTSRAFYAEQLCRFSEELAKFCGSESVLLMNSGTEAVESAFKLARKWGYEKRKIAADKAKIIGMRNNFHGRSIAVLSLSTEPLYTTGFGPFTPGFGTVPFGNTGALEKEIDSNTVAVILEPIQAEAGILIPPDGYLLEVRRLCTRHNVLLILDEIQTGMGRTGRDFCFQHEGILPDILVVGKSLGGGLLPLSAIAARREIMEVLRPGEHGSTFGGNPLACAVGRTALALLRDEKLAMRATRLGEIAMTELCSKPLAKVKEIRGKGLLIGVELHASLGGARPFCEKLGEAGVLVKETHDHVVRIAPPLVISEEDLLSGVRKIINILS